jgi:hypothetical protein
MRSTAARDGRELIAEQELGVDEHPAEQRALAVVHRPGGRQAQQVAFVGGHQK